MATLFQVLQFLDTDGFPLSLGTVHFYEAGSTTTYKTTWKDAGESATHTSPIVLGADGAPPGGAIFLRGSYKMIVKRSDGTTILTIDNINEYDQRDWTGLTASVADLNSTTTSIISASSVYTVNLGDRGKTISANTTSASFNINLPSATVVGNTFKICIKKTDLSVNTVSIIPYGSEKIDTLSSLVLYDFGDFAAIRSDGSNFFVEASNLRGSIVNVSAARSITLADHNLMFNCDASSGSYNISLPKCKDVGKGFDCCFKKVDSSANTITLIPNGIETIDSASNYVLYSRDHYVRIKTDGLNWYIKDESGQSSLFSTGMVIASYALNIPGFVWMNDGSIGNSFSGATSRANNDTQDLFFLLWTVIPYDNLCQEQTSTGVPCGRSASAAIAYSSNHRLTIPHALGRAMCSIGKVTEGGIFSYGFGGRDGSELRTMDAQTLTYHTHNYQISKTNYASKGGDHPTFDFTTSDISSPTGQSLPFNIIQPIMPIAYWIKL